MFKPRHKYGRMFRKLKTLNIWDKMILLSFYSSESCHLSEYTLKWFDGPFDTSPRHTQSTEFSRLSNKIQVGFLVYSTLRGLCLVFLFNFF